MNHTNMFHLYYLIVNDIREEKYNGLSHVAEHTLLFPSEEVLQFWGKGRTYLNHVCLYYTCDSLEVLKEVDRQIINGEIITNINVDCAKQQVIEEIKNLEKDTHIKHQIVGFITDDRIQRFSIGNIEQVSSIQTEDVYHWFRDKQQQGYIFRYLFQNAHQMILSTPVPADIIDQKILNMNQIDSTVADRIFRVNPDADATVIKLYLKVKMLYKKEDIIKKAFYEYCIQKKIKDTLAIDVLINDEYFDANERFSVLSFPWNNESRVTDSLNKIRQTIRNISVAEFEEYKAEYKMRMLDFLTLDESNFEVINKMKNYLLYGIPKVERGDLKITDHISYNIFPIDWLTKAPLRVIIK